jgi:hypothetical protein
MRAHLEDKLFSATLIDEMHAAFETACAELALCLRPIRQRSWLLRRSSS